VCVGGGGLAGPWDGQCVDWMADCGGERLFRLVTSWPDILVLEASVAACFFSFFFIAGWQAVLLRMFDLIGCQTGCFGSPAY